MPRKTRSHLFINKSKDSAKLSSSQGSERARLYSHVQRKYEYSLRSEQITLEIEDESGPASGFLEIARSSAQENNPASETWSGRETRMSSWNLSGSNHSEMLQTIDSSASIRQQLLSRFFESHFPQLVTPESDFARHKSFLKPLLTAPLTPRLISSALDALSFSDALQATRDSRYLPPSLLAFSRTVDLLRKAIVRPSDESREALCAILILMLVDPQSLNDQHPNPGWQMHLFGAQRFFTAHAQCQLDQTRMFDAALVRTMLVNAIWVGIAQRKALDVIVPGIVAHELPANHGQRLFRHQEFLSTYQNLPRLLHETDELLSEECCDIRAKVEELDLRLEILRYRGLRGAWALKPSGTVSVSNGWGFDPLVEEQCFMSASSGFSVFHLFQEACDSVLFAKAVMMALIIDCTLLQIRHSPRYVVGCKITRSTLEIECDARIHADELCKTIYSLSQLKSLASADFISVILNLTQSFYEESEILDKAGWTQACMIANDVRRCRLRMLRPTLCKVGNVAVDFRKIGKYSGHCYHADSQGVYSKTPSADGNLQSTPTSNVAS